MPAIPEDPRAVDTAGVEKCAGCYPINTTPMNDLRDMARGVLTATRGLDDMLPMGGW